MRILRLGWAEGWVVDGGGGKLHRLPGGPVKAPVKPIFEVIPVMVKAGTPLDAIAEYTRREVADAAYREVAGEAAYGCHDGGAYGSVRTEDRTGRIETAVGRETGRETRQHTGGDIVPKVRFQVVDEIRCWDLGREGGA